jgi:hypothetical protein
MAGIRWFHGGSSKPPRCVLLRVGFCMLLCALALVSSAPAASGPSPSSGQEDTEAPLLTELAIEPAEIDTSASDQNVSITAHITDNLSGVREALVRCASPDGKQQLLTARFEHVSGTDTDGTWRAVVTVPHYSEAGTWRVTAITLEDNVGNTRLVPPSNAGFPSTIEVTNGTPDTEAPILTGLSIEPSSVNTSSSDQTVLVTAHVTDNLSGVRDYSGEISFKSPTSYQWAEGTFHKISGIDTNGVYQAEVKVRRYATSGTWPVYGFALYDNAGNVRYYGGKLTEMGLPHTIEVESAEEDGEAPVLQSLTIEPSTVNPYSSSQVAIATAHITDNLSGFWFGYLRFRSAATSQSTTAEFYRVAGTETDGIYRAELGFNRYIAAGPWYLEGVWLADNADNFHFTQRSRLEEQGLFQTVQVDYAATVSSEGDTSGSVEVSSSAPGSTLSEVSSEAVSTAGLPKGAVAIVGGLSYQVSGLEAGGTADVTIQLPPGSDPTAVYKLVNGSYINVTSIAAISGSTITMHLTDGGLGDEDGTANGVIVDPIVPIRIGKATTTSLTVAPSGVAYGSENEEHFSVSVVSPNGVPPGKVSVKAGSTTVCTVTLNNGSGNCSPTATKLKPGSYSLAAIYAGTSAYSTSTSVPHSLTVAKAATTTSLALSAAEVPYGSEQTEVFSASASATGVVPGGSVSIKAGSKVLCKAKLSAGHGSCSPTATKLPAGTHSIVATYPESSTMLSSSSAPATLTVN